MSKTIKDESPKTKFVGRSPFTGERVGSINPDKLELTDDAPPTIRSSRFGKYTAIFTQAIATGKRIKCESEEAAKIATSLKKFMKDRKVEGTIRSTSNYPADGKGGVWFIKSAGASN